MAVDTDGINYNQVGFDNLLQKGDEGLGLMTTNNQVRSPLVVDAEQDASNKKGYTALALIKTMTHTFTFPVSQNNLPMPVHIAHGLGATPADVKGYYNVPGIGAAPYPIPEIQGNSGLTSVTMHKAVVFGQWNDVTVPIYFTMSGSAYGIHSGKECIVTLKLYQEIAV